MKHTKYKLIPTKGVGEIKFFPELQKTHLKAQTYTVELKGKQEKKVTWYISVLSNNTIYCCSEINCPENIEYSMWHLKKLIKEQLKNYK